MAPKKKAQAMSLGSFLQDEKLGSWADEMEDMPVSDSRTGYGSSEKRTYNSSSGTYSSGAAAGGGYSVREEIPLPDKPPYTVHLGNLSFDATVPDVEDFFAGCDCTSVRIIEDKLDMKPKGFGYAEFSTREGVLKALPLSGSQFQGRNIRISVADPPKDRDRPDAREFGDWSRKGPLADLPGRTDRQGPNRGFGGEERRDRFPEGDGKTRDFSSWERKGPLSPLAQQEPRSNPFREAGATGAQEPREGGFQERRNSPAAWGEGRPAGEERPRREFQERPIVERAPTAAEQDNQWRNKMRPDAPAVPASATPAGESNDAPASPSVAAAPAPAPVGRPRLNLAKRTVSQAVDVASPASESGDAKASPFGAARPIDTATKEKEIEEKRIQALTEKKEAEEKAREEKKLAQEAADKEKADNDAKAAAEAASKPADAPTEEGKTETIETENANGTIVDDKSVQPKEVVRDAKPKANTEGAWRRPSNGPKPPRNDGPRDGPRHEGNRGSARGPRNEGRGGRANGERQASYQQQQQAPAAPAQEVAPAPVDPETAQLEADGWSTVSKPKKNQRNSQPPRALAS